MEEKSTCTHTHVNNNSNIICGFFFKKFDIKIFAKISKKLANLFGFTLRKKSQKIPIICPKNYKFD
jgi:hypothetical protein